MFRVIFQKKFYAIALIVALLTLKASLSALPLQNLPSDLHAGSSFMIASTITETSAGTPLRLGREKSGLLNHISAILLLATKGMEAEPARPSLALLVVFSAWILAIGKGQSAAPQSDMVSRK